MDEQQPKGPKPTPEQEAAVRRHLKYQRGQRSGDEEGDGGAQSPLTFTSAGIVLKIGLKVIERGLGLIAGGGGRNDVYWGFPIGTLAIVAGALICGFGIVVWSAVTVGHLIYRAISG